MSSSSSTMAENFRVNEEEERQNIIDRYEQGREQVLANDGIDEWEDPTNEIYQITDRYGFIHDYKLPEKLTKHENQIREVEMKRREKWRKMITNWDYYKKKNFDKLRERVFKGIPNAVRGSAWMLLLDVPRIKDEQQNRYEEMYNLGKQYSREIRQIDLDVNRTFRNNMMFRERYNIKQQELFRVLVAYSVYNQEVGYCQGMSQLAALLLMFTSEEDTFWALDRLMSDEKYAMHGFFVAGFPKLERFSKHHDLVLKKFLNKVYKHFRKFDIESTLYTLKWFFQCFLDRVPFSLTLRLWDCFMVDGERILTCMSYTLLKLHKKTLLRKNMDDLIPFLQVDLEKDFGYHDDDAIAELQKSIDLLHKHKMDVPLEAPTEQERPSKPFGLISQHAETVSIINDDRSMVESELNCKPFRDRDENASIANTSKTSSAIDVNEFKEDIIDDDLEMSEICKRKLSVYDNVDLNESFEAAKRLASEERERHDQPESLELQRLNDDANLEQFTDGRPTSSTDAASQHAAGQPTASSKQSNGQMKHTQNGRTNGQHENTQRSAGNEANHSRLPTATDLPERQSKKTSSFREKFLRRKSSIPTLKRNDSQRQSKNRPSTEVNNKKYEVRPTDFELESRSPDRRSPRSPEPKSPEPKSEPVDYRADRLSDSSLDAASDHLDHRSQKLIKSPSSSSSNKTSTPIGKSSQIPRLNSSIGHTPAGHNATGHAPTGHSSLANKLVASESQTVTSLNSRFKAAAPSSIPTNSTAIKSNLSTSDEAPRPIKIYVPYAEISSRNNSKTNSLASSTNSINGGANGLKTKKDDQNKITINVNQKYEIGKGTLKSYLPTIDT